MLEASSAEMLLWHLDNSIPDQCQTGSDNFIIQTKQTKPSGAYVHINELERVKDLVTADKGSYATP
jgi:hypothetical protein